MKSFTILFFSFLIGNSFAHAGDKIGNGGDVVVCRDDKGTITSIELLDFYEAREYRHILKDLGDATWSVEQKIQYVMNRLSRLDPERADRYSKECSSFLDDSVFLPGKELPDLNDSHHLGFPKGCKVEQIVIATEQRFPEEEFWFPQGKKYVINPDLWSNPLFGTDDKAALILHEVIYAEARNQFHHTNSIQVRYFNSYVTSNVIESFTLPQYIEILKRSGINQFQYLGIDLRVNDRMEFFPSGKIEYAERYMEFTNPNPKNLLDSPQTDIDHMELSATWLIDEDGFPLYPAMYRFTEFRKIHSVVELEMYEFHHLYTNSEKPPSYYYQTFNDSWSTAWRELIDIFGIHLKSRPDCNSIQQFINLREALNDFTDDEKSALKKRVRYVEINQARPRGFWGAEDSDLILVKRPSDGLYDLSIHFDNNSYDKEFVSVAEIKKVIQTILAENSPTKEVQ